MNTTSTFYPRFTADSRFSPQDLTCIRKTVERLQSTSTTGDRPGMLLGKIQSGKTKTFLGIIALGFDNDFDIAVILTKGTKALARQTVSRVQKDFKQFIDEDRLQVFDIMEVPAGLTGYELNQKLILVAKKEDDNLNRLTKLFKEQYPTLKGRRVLIVDDEADYASVGFRRSKDEGIVINTTTRQIDKLRALLASSSFLQVTATPYSLYLQPEDVRVNGVEFSPVRPAFTELVPVNADYVGSDLYFDHPTEQGSVARYLYESIPVAELEVLRGPDGRRLKLADVLTSPAIKTLRAALCNFIVGACVRRLQDRKHGVAEKKFSFLFHTEAQRKAHDWQEAVVGALEKALSTAAEQDPARLTSLLDESFKDLAVSIEAKRHYLPTRADVIAEVLKALRDGWLMVTKVNSDRHIAELLDDSGQLRLRTPLNLFIGGQILDRGITVANLIGFFYGRRPQVYQQDTVLQHSRMFGFRPIEDLTVTRFYTAQVIYDAMRRMHESDVALRDSIEANPTQPVVFIQRDANGRVVPCSPNKILVSNTTTLRPFTRMLPVGFQTDYKTRVAPLMAQIDAGLALTVGAVDRPDPERIALSEAIHLLDLIRPTLLMAEDDGYTFDWDAAKAALEYMSKGSRVVLDRESVWCLVRRNRNLGRFVNVGPRQAYSDAPDTSHIEGKIARDTAKSIPMLMLFRQNGDEAKGWRGTPFYWPVIVAPEGTRTAIFSHEADV